jgi:3-dehydroquinate dehydratase/shikimate dehydrogenase
VFDCIKSSNFPARAQELANIIGGTALTLSELENYHPEEGMILANATSVGMYPNVDGIPLSKVLHSLA